ncbi:hypothetical protein GW17_00057937, partial [Ensete ventricosum]
PRLLSSSSRALCRKSSAAVFFQSRPLLQDLGRCPLPLPTVSLPSSTSARRPCPLCSVAAQPLPAGHFPLPSLPFWSSPSPPSSSAILMLQPLPTLLLQPSQPCLPLLPPSIHAVVTAVAAATCTSNVPLPAPLIVSSPASSSHLAVALAAATSMTSS